MYQFVNSKIFTYTWFGISFLMLFLTSLIGYTGFTWLFILTFLDSFSDIWLEHWYSLGISRRLTLYNCLANALGVVVQVSYGLYGGAVTSMVGFFLLLNKTLTWDDTKDGRISYFKRQEMTITAISVFIGIVLLGIIYGRFFRGEQPIWLIVLNVLLFVLGTCGRILLINGKIQSQYIYVIRELIDLAVFFSMISLHLTSESLWIRLGSIISSLIILFKSIVNWIQKSKIAGPTEDNLLEQRKEER
ncbi:nicotinamide mononucleotide transporter [Streptococcus suis]|uniref:nicotinamide mononucleotide transporter n=1 Tax=Streptococcus suis TaxID=1307 RepID=UPI000CF5D32C|nr:nicotinamide mononucleotide transporter [Streptococcus suis]HEM5111621.1 nicotinamide mononucleotide transporter [Streptococcus suis]